MKAEDIPTKVIFRPRYCIGILIARAPTKAHSGGIEAIMCYTN